MLTFSDGEIGETEKKPVFCEECDHYLAPQRPFGAHMCWHSSNVEYHPVRRNGARFTDSADRKNRNNDCPYFTPKKKTVEQKKSKFKSLLIPVLILFLAGIAFVCVMYIF